MNINFRYFLQIPYDTHDSNMANNVIVVRGVQSHEVILILNCLISKMKKSNSKELYKLARRLKVKQHQPVPDDSLEIALQPPALPTKKPSHSRSQSCPFNVHLNNNQPSVNHQKKPSHQSSLSQASIGSQTVIIRQLPTDQPTSQCRKAPRRQILKKSVLGLKNDNYTNTRVSQQIRTYQLKRQLQNVEKESQNTCVKQRILESLLLRCQSSILEHSFEFA